MTLWASTEDAVTNAVDSSAPRACRLDHLQEGGTHDDKKEESE
eukprot:CAMPEP_0115875576 /NCGR_PEP_ID=MMETSP0287-20121206/25169_1 /TAXON_ID=412157 /ORGANISM="Chrysochromulina rotalis, Strain UIO044" /LENGTH=42 /DNA_ID= /DNA_START= /DNA_END= /DNA_ORIENTATION=